MNNIIEVNEQGASSLRNAYHEFLASKRTIAPTSGIEVAREDIHPQLFPFQQALVQWALRKGRAALFTDTGTGKALPVDTRVLTPQGYRTMGELQVGDKVIGSNGQPTTVLGIYPQGSRPSYRVAFCDRTDVHCDIEHLWPVRTKVQRYRKQEYKPLTLKEIMELGLRSQEGWRFFIPITQPIEFEQSELLLDPYLLGALLGDGGLSRGIPVLTSADEEIVDRVASALPSGVQLSPAGKYGWSIGAGSRNGHRVNPVTHALRQLGLMGCRSEHKFIPDSYKFASLQSREALLQGLLDTDGYIDLRDTYIEYCTVSPQLADDVAFLVQSLGGIARISPHKTTGQLAYRIGVALPASIFPFYLARKANAYHPRQKYQPTRAIVSVEPDGEAEMVCIAVDSPDHCYIIEHCVVTHNSRMQAEWARIIGDATGGRVLILAPLAVTHQTIMEAASIGVTITYCRDQSDVPGVGIAISNYERLERFDASAFAGIVLDESSILKAFSGVTKKLLIKTFANTPYKLCCTATPAPNDLEELCNHADFLGVMKPNEMRSTFFIADSRGEFMKYRLKRHARKAFFRWLASWAMAMKVPSDLGYEDDGFVLPGLQILGEFVESDYVPPGQLFATEVRGISEATAVRRGTLSARVERVASLIAREPEEPWLVWCGLNDEGRELARLIPSAVVVEGSDPVETKTTRLLDFAEGRTRVLITKPSIAGFGMNFQICARMAFLGIGYSYEQYYQALRRCYRYGQKREVVAYVVLGEQEEPIYEAVLQKEAEATELSSGLLSEAREYERAELFADTSAADDYEPRMPIQVPTWLEGVKIA